MKLVKYSVLAIFISVVISTCTSINPKMSLWGVPQRYEGLLCLTCYFLLFYMVTKYFKPKDFGIFSFTVIAIACASIPYAILQNFWIDIYEWEGNYGLRPFSTFSHPAFYSAFLTMAMPFLYHEILKGRKWLIPILLAVIYVMLITKTRAALVGMGVSGIYFYWFYRLEIPYRIFEHFYGYKNLKPPKKYIYIILALIISVNLIMKDSPVKKFFNNKGTINSRIEMWGVGLNIIEGYPILGVGPDCISEVYRYKYLERYNAILKRDQNRLHNEFLDVTAQRGLVGLFAWVLFLFAYFRVVWKNRQNPIVIVLSSSVVAYLVQNMFSFGSIPITVLFWYLIGMTLVIVRENGK